ncbi:MAG: hypothetical protein HY067_17855 [Betaproteobacteria bacterium]|nr:hypothetical protein [Betaproteobacteria bacterium]
MLLLLGAVSLAPFVGSLLFYYFWKPQTFTNYGELIAVAPLTGVTIPARDNKPFRFDDLRGNWIFLMADSGNCDDYCQSKLYVMRQIRLTQGKDQERIERVWLIPDGERPPPAIEAEYQGTRTILPATDDFRARLPASGSPRDHIYVIDPFGNLMMRFPRNVDPQRMKKDVNKLMKISGGWIQTGK